MNLAPSTLLYSGATAVVFVTLFPLLLLLESRRPRSAVPGGWRRRASNFAMIMLSVVCLRLVFPLGLVGFAAAWQRGLFHVWQVPTAIAVVASLVVLDLAIYWQHRAFHYWPLLWRAHRVHHSDLGFDTSLGVRFHPFETVPSFGWKLLVIALLGASPGIAATYEASLFAFSLFSHANAALPPKLDRALRLAFITPDWHRVHHSVRYDESNSNFGNLLSVWDRCFGTARERPREPLAAMTLGLPAFRDSRSQRLHALLAQPFRSERGGMPPFQGASDA